MIELWFSQDEDFPAPNHHKNLVARFQGQRFASLTWDHDLVFRGKSCFIIGLLCSVK